MVKKANTEEKKIIKDVTDLPGVGDTTAEKLIGGGFFDLITIAASTVDRITEVTGIGGPAARKIIGTARDALDLGFEEASEVEKRRNNLVRISTGLKEFDDLIGGGYEPCSITELAGEFGSSKTQLAHILAVNTIKMDEKNIVYYIDSENSFRPERIRQLAKGADIDTEVALRQIKVARAYSSDHQILLVNKIGKIIAEGENNIKVIIVDSLTSLLRTEMCGMGQLALRQQKLNKHIHDLMRIADCHNIIVLVTNQVMAVPGIVFGNPLQPIGGNILSHNAKTILFLRKGKKGSRVAKLIDSPHLEDGEVNYYVEKDGLKPVVK